MEDELGIIWLICCSTILPILCVWLSSRKKINETNKRTEIVMAALEKNPDMDITEWLDKMAPEKKLIKERLLSKLIWGIICLISGLGLIGCGVYLGVSNAGETDDPISTCIIGGAILAIGIALVVSFVIGKNFLAKEIEAEQQKAIQK